jgi:hypothetical protein
MATSLVAVAVPAFAAGSPDPTGVISTIQNGLDPSATPTPDASGTPPVVDSSAPASASPSASATPTPTASTSGPAGNPVTDLATCLAAAGLNPTAAQKCFTDAVSGLQGQLPSGGTGGAPDPTTALTTFFACAQTALTAKSTAAGEKCGTDLFAALGISQAKCLDPTLQPLLSAIDGLLGGDPAKLQAEVTNLPNTLPGQLQALPNCLQGTSDPTATPTPTPTPSVSTGTGTSGASGAATSDPIAAVAVAATPNFTG